MRRDEAIALLAAREVAALDDAQRRDLAFEWLSDEGDLEPSGDAICAAAEAAVRHKFTGVLNAYLERRLAVMGRIETVVGDLEPLFACPCCGSRTLHERGCWDICLVCFWEDDGITDVDVISGPNHMSLAEARRNFATIGAVSEAMRAHVLPDGRERYPFEPRVPL